MNCSSLPPISRLRSIMLLLPLFIMMYSCGESEPRSSSAPENVSESRELSFPGRVDFLKTSPDAADSSENVITSIDVALALNDEQRQLGLMNVHRLPSNKGMLFIFDEQEPLSFWMANTPLSLDMIFVNEAMQIVRIQRNTRPYSQQQYPSEAPARYVVEVTAGFTVRHDIQEGQYIAFDLGQS